MNTIMKGDYYFSPLTENEIENYYTVIDKELEAKNKRIIEERNKQLEEEREKLFNWSKLKGNTKRAYNLKIHRDRKLKFSEEKKEEINNLLKTHSIAEVAEMVGISTSSLHTYWFKSSIHKSRKQFNENEENLMVVLYQNGYTLKNISERFGVSSTFIYKVIKKKNGSIRKRGYRVFKNR